MMMALLVYFMNWNVEIFTDFESSSSSSFLPEARWLLLNSCVRNQNQTRGDSPHFAYVAFVLSIKLASDETLVLIY